VMLAPGEVLCFESAAIPLLRPKFLWSHIVFEIADGDFKLYGDSSDSQLGIDALRGPRNVAAVKERIQRYNRKDELTQLTNWLERFLPAGLLQRDRLYFSPFGASCVILRSVDGQHGQIPVTVRLEGLWFNYPRNMLFGLGLIAIAPMLSEFIVFYYITGITLGVLLCIAFSVTYAGRRIAPNRRFVPLFGLFTEGTLFMAAMWSEAMQDLIDRYKDYIAILLVFTVVASFAVTHYFLRGNGESSSGPSAGVKDLVRWLIQVGGYGMIFCSTASLQWGFALVMITFTSLVIGPAVGSGTKSLLDSLCPSRGIRKLTKCYLTMGRFLSEEEYEEQKRLTTDHEITKLIRSEAFKQWAVNNTHRIRVLPHESGGDMVEAEPEQKRSGCIVS